MTAIEALMISQAVMIVCIGLLAWTVFKGMGDNSDSVREVSGGLRSLTEIMANSLRLQKSGVADVARLAGSIEGLVRANYPRPCDLTVEHEARTATLKALETIAINLGVMYGPEVVEAFTKLEAWSDVKAANDLMTSTLARGDL